MSVHADQVSDGNPGQKAIATNLTLESALRTAIAERLGELRFGLWFGEEVHLNFGKDGSTSGSPGSQRLLQ